MSVFRRILPLLAAVATVACSSPSTGAIEDLSENAPATITSSPPSAGADGSGADGQDGQDGRAGQAGQDGQDGRGASGNGAGGKDTGTPPTSSRGPGSGSLSVTNNDVMIGAAFANRNIYSFGSMPPGSTTTESLTVGGGEGLTVTSVEVISTTGAFRLAKDECTGTRFPGPSCQVIVAATPPTAGEHEGVLEIYYTEDSGASGSSGRDLSVSGEPVGSGENGPDEEITEIQPTTSG